MKSCLCLVLFAFLATTAYSQTKKPPLCAVTIDQVPLIRGLRLGEPYEHLQTVLPIRLQGINFKPDDLGLRSVLISPDTIIDPKSLNGVMILSLSYLDDSLSSIDITYDTTVRWQSNLHFAAAIAEQLKLPRQGWLQRDPTFLICQGFFVEVSGATFLPKLRIVDLRFGEELTKRKAEVEEKKRARFRP